MHIYFHIPQSPQPAGMTSAPESGAVVVGGLYQHTATCFHDMTIGQSLLGTMLGGSHTNSSLKHHWSGHGQVCGRV